MWRRRAGVLGLALCVLGLPAPRAAAGERAEVLLRIGDPRVVESSGLAASRRHPGVLWTHNDSGDAARLFAVGGDGRVLATLRLAGVEARDWEAVAVGRDDRGRPALFAGDIGDNLDAWPWVTVWRVPEPARLRDATVRAERYRLRYPDGPRNAEALLVDPRRNRLYVASKDDTGGALYRAPAELRADRVNLLQRVGRVPALVTDGAFSPDGRLLVLRDYEAAHLYRASGGRLATVALPFQPQGESVAFSADGRSLLAGSEGAGSEVWRVPLPAAALPAVTTTRPPAGEAASAPPAATPPPAAATGRLVTVALAALALVAVAIAAGVARTRRRRRGARRRG
jgi:hypothetical protein